ncbi:hypothetical protein EV137_2730 [Kribbella pratensis]|uniref:Uncharacterized protein n=1 Tax=Kribbella pratensis TaxID=2512112 RepID=A0ABY2FQG1_9ACTN|nr:hypothetical protein EV137_2730 [Kribbella pratensis]
MDNALTVLRHLGNQMASEYPFEAVRTQLVLGQVCRRVGHKALANRD